MSEFKEVLKFSGQPQQQQQRQPAAESLFAGAPVSNFFSDHFSDCDFRSFSHLLAGTIPENMGVGDKGSAGGSGACGFKQHKPGNLVLPVPVSPVFAVSPGFSPSAFLSSPTLLSTALNPYNISQQQTLAQITAQAALSQAHLSISPEFPPSSSLTHQPSAFPRHCQAIAEPGNAERRPQNFPIVVDKPADDGYNWRKYGQKQVKGSEYPRSYYRCTHSNCPVKKKVERSFDGHITEIIYKGQHNHERPQSGRRAGKDGSLVNDHGSEGLVGNFRWPGRDYDSAQATSMQLHGPSDSEESGEDYQLVEDDDDDDDDEPKAKRRNAGAGQSEVTYTHKTMTEPKIVVQTKSEVDLLDDGYRWRKYGQKVVKGNPNPRSYYKCTTAACKVRKHVERASTDPKAVITTYEGKHNHDVPAARGSSITAANIEAQQMKLHNTLGQMSFGNNDRQVTLRLKEEQLV